MASFADFIAPFDAETFRTQYFGKQPVHIRRAGAAMPDILNWARFNEALAITPYWNEERLKVYYKNRAALRENYCDLADTPRGQPAPVNAAKVKALVALGASLVANHINRVCPKVAAVANTLEREFAARVRANVYCSFQGVQAFQTHYDLHDVFAYQAEGEKAWRVYEACADAPVNPLPPGEDAEKWLIRSRGQLLFEVVMQPGDVLYLPRGQYHDALTGAKASLHVTFGVSPATGLALLDLLEKTLTGESAFRAYLPDARDESALREHLARLADRMRAVVTSPAFAIDVMNHQRGQALVSAEYDLPLQGRSTWYSVVRTARVVRRDEGFVVAFEGGEIAIGAINPTVEWILTQRMFSLEDAAALQKGVDRRELIAMLARLGEVGIIVETEMTR